MDYSKMSDFEINKRVADIAMNGTWHLKPSHPDNNTGGWLYGSNGIQTYDLPDYCNNPADAWPIITANLMRITPIYGAEVIWLVSRDVYAATDENPLRAAMLVYLQLQEAK